jgi:hypothetical protein
MTAFANFSTDDWNVPHKGTSDAPVTFDCTDGSGQAHSYLLTQQTDWLDAGFTNDRMFTVGQQIIAATMNAFPNQLVALPIHVTLSKTDTSLAFNIVNDSYAKYPGRFVAQNNAVAANTPTPEDNPDVESDQLILAFLSQKAPNLGLQMLAAAANGDGSNGNDDSCRQNGGVSPCAPGPVMASSINAALAYRPLFLEFWNEDSVTPAAAGAPDLRCIQWNATYCLNGTARAIPGGASLRCPPFSCPVP